MRAASPTSIDQALAERMRDRLVEACNPENLPSEEEARGLVEKIDAIRSEVQNRLSSGT